MILRLLALLLLPVSLALLTWGVRPVASRTQILMITRAEISPPGIGGHPDGNPNQTAGRLYLEWPNELRLGDAGEVRLSFTPEIQPAASLPAVEGAGRVLQSRLELAGIVFTPSGEISQALSLAHPVTFLWSLRAGQEGDFPATVWLHLRFPSAGVSQETRTVLTAQNLEIPVTALFGLSGAATRILGWVGLAVGLALGAGDVVSRALQAALERNRNKG